MAALLETLLAITLIVFMVGSLLEVGLRLDIAQATLALRNGTFVGLTLAWSFVLCPAFAWLLAAMIPLAQPYAVGLMFLGLAPCAPFVPLLSQRAHGDLAYVAGFILLAAVGTVITMPLLTAVLIPGFSVEPWMIAKPLVIYVAAPLAVGIAARRICTAAADRAHPIVKKVTSADTIVMLVIVLWIYREDILTAVGSYAIGTQFLFYAAVAWGAYRFGFGLKHSQKVALALGASTRNIGAAFAPLVSAAGIDRRTITMVVLAVPISVLCGFATAYLLAREKPEAGQSPSLAA